MSTAPREQPSPEASRASRRPPQMLAERAHRRSFAWLLAVELGLLAIAIQGAPFAVTRLALPWGLGVVAWTLAEYLLHRFAFHLPRSHALARFGAKQHLDHHDDPSRPPITKPLVLTLPPLLAATVVLGSTWGAWGLACGAGLVAGYFAYEVIHVAAHVLGDAHPLPRLQRWHLGHHAEVRSAFGISSPLWDLVFGTWPR